MYYSQQCSYCYKIFFIYEHDKYIASEKLYLAIKKHLGEYGEDDKEYKYDDGLVKDSQEIYLEMKESVTAPPGAYEVR